MRATPKRRNISFAVNAHICRSSSGVKAANAHLTKRFLDPDQPAADLENKIAAARRFMNSAAAEYNAATQQFPALLLAAQLGFAPAQMFELDATERVQTRDAPKVSLGG